MYSMTEVEANLRARYFAATTKEEQAKIKDEIVYFKAQVEFLQMATA